MARSPPLTTMIGRARRGRSTRRVYHAGSARVGRGRRDQGRWGERETSDRGDRRGGRGGGGARPGCRAGNVLGPERIRGAGTLASAAAGGAAGGRGRDGAPGRPPQLHP